MIIDVFFLTPLSLDQQKLCDGLVYVDWAPTPFWHGLVKEENLTKLPPYICWEDSPGKIIQKPDGGHYHEFAGRGAEVIYRTVVRHEEIGTDKVVSVEGRVGLPDFATIEADVIAERKSRDAVKKISETTTASSLLID